MPRVMIAHMLGGEAGDQIDELRARFDPKTASAIDSHVTVAGPYDSEVHASEYAPVIAQLARDRHPFTIRLRGIDCFLPASKTVFVSIEDGGALTQLNAHLLQKLGWKNEFPYRPHATISEYLDETNTREACELLQTVAIDIEYTLTSLSLLQKGKDGKWELIKAFVFRSAGCSKPSTRKTRQTKKN